MNKWIKGQATIDGAKTNIVANIDFEDFYEVI